MSAACTWGWPLVVLMLAWRHRPRRSPVLPGPDVSRSIREAGVPFGRVPAPLGRAVRTMARRPPDARAEALLGATIVVVAALAVISPVVAAVAGAGAVLRPRLAARRLARARVDEVVEELPQVVDLLALAVGAGLPALGAVEIAAGHCHGPVGRAFGHARRAVELGTHPDVAFGEISGELGEPVRPLVVALLGSARDGTPLEPALARLGQEARTVRRRRAEEAARQLPIKLLFPLVLCTLPAFVLLTVVPLLAGALGSLRA